MRKQESEKAGLPAATTANGRNLFHVPAVCFLLYIMMAAAIYGETKGVTVTFGSHAYQTFKTTQAGENHTLNINKATPAPNIARSLIAAQDTQDQVIWQPAGITAAASTHTYTMSGAALNEPLWVEIEGEFVKSGAGGAGAQKPDFVVSVLKVELKSTHPQDPGPTGSAAKYNNNPTNGSADNLFSTWLNEQFRVNVNIQPTELANNLPSGFIKWTAAGFTISDNTTNYTFSWDSTGVKEITVELPSCGITKKVRVDVPDVGILSQTAAVALVGAPSVFVLAYAQEAINYSNINFPVGPQRDAFRHAYWMSLSVSQLGVAQWEALLISTGHEHNNRDDDHQQAFNSTMDLHNNSVGSGITHTTLLGTPDRTPIQNDITQQYTNGGLWIWRGGGAQENSEGILVKSNGSKIYSD